MQVEEVDRIDAEALQRCLAGLADVLGPAVLAEHVVREVLDDETRLGRDHDIVSATGDRTADE